MAKVGLSHDLNSTVPPFRGGLRRADASVPPNNDDAVSAGASSACDTAYACIRSFAPTDRMQDVHPLHTSNEQRCWRGCQRATLATIGGCMAHARALWQSVCTSIHTHTHTSIRAHTTQMIGRYPPSQCSSAPFKYTFVYIVFLNEV